MGMAKTCGDCIHADICEHLPSLPLFHRKNEAHCVTFKDKADYVEVVRCKDCKHHYENDDFICIGVKDDDFCSYGERREGE